jgi:TolB-like protein/Tfp pilus assembly protein PilF
VRGFLNEIKRRDLIRPLLAYAGVSWLLLQVVDVLSGLLNLHPLFAPGVLLVLICGLPVVIYLCWHFDISLDGIRRTPGRRSSDELTPEPFGLLNWAGLAVIVFLSVFSGVHIFEAIRDERLAAQEGQVTIREADSIAVLPFVDQSPEQDQGYLAVGVAEEITSLLGRNDYFRVMASRSGQILSAQGLSPVDIGRRLQVDAVLAGSIRASGSRLRIRVELLDMQDGRTLWTESFLRELKDIFEVESEISRAVVNLLQDEYLQSGTFSNISNTSSTDAYVMYLKGREAYRRQTTESMREARRLFEQTLALDPEYAQAYVALADTLAALSEGGEGFGVLKPEIAAALAEENLNKAIVREPDIADIYAVLGVVNMLRNNLDDSLSNFDKAIQLNPNLALAYMWKSLALNDLQRFDEAIEALRTARRLDPLFLTSSYNLGLLLSWRGRTDEAEGIFRQMAQDFPESPFPFMGLSDIYYGRGDYAGAIREIRRAAELSPDNNDLVQQLVGPMLQLGLTDIVAERATEPGWAEAVDYFQANILFLEGRYDELFERMAFELAANPDDYWVAFEAGWYHAMLDHDERASELLLRHAGRIDEVDTYTMPGCSPAIEMAWARRVDGDEAGYRELLDRCSQLLAEQERSAIEYFELDYLKARIGALQGDKEAALAALATAVDKGWREWWTEFDPLLRGLREYAGYQLSVGLIRSDLERQRSQARRLFADSPLPSR